MKFKESLYKDGFVHLKQIIAHTHIDLARKNITHTHVNYSFTHEYTKLMMRLVHKYLDLDLKCIKYRVSNNNNSTDASSFHRDLQIHTPELIKTNTIPNVFTTLSYLDPTVMQLIPGSHKKNSESICSAFQQFNKKKELNIEPGDILIFYATTIHRGIFYNKQDNRRLIQCFDCVPQKEQGYLTTKILHLPCYPYCSKMMRKIFLCLSKIRPIISIINYINYLNVATGYGYEWGVLKRYGYETMHYLSTESNNHRLQPVFNNEFEPINKYIILENVIDANPYHSYKIKQFYGVANIAYTISISILISIIVILIFKLSNRIRS